MKLKKMFEFLKSKLFILLLLFPVLFFIFGFLLAKFIGNVDKNLTLNQIKTKECPICETCFDKNQTINQIKMNECPVCKTCFDENQTIYFQSSEKYPSKLLLATKTLSFVLPEDIYLKLLNSSIISFDNKSFFSIELEGPLNGVCSDNEFGNSCKYDDEKNIPNIGTLRIWKIDGKIIAINPQDLSLDGKYISHMVIMKRNPDLLSDSRVYFTTEEVNIWKNILSNPIVRESN